MLTQEQIKKDVLEFLRENTTAVVATSFNDEPRASTVYYYVDDNFNFYFVTKRNTSKYLNIEMNPHVALVIGTGPEHITVQVHGEGKFVADDEQKDTILEKLLDILAREHVKLWPIDDMPSFKDRHKVVFKITPHKVLFLNLDSSTHTDSRSEDFIQVFP
jgi:nitroimidazol reductase NimA-like FMN-containing flavoprotein (pyridoxamine 5'-phosphate oxidase superfamily)